MTPAEEILHQAVIEKIKNDWDSKWKNTQGNYPADFSGLKSQNAFFKSLQKVVEEKHGRSASISVDSIRRFIKKEPAEFGFRASTLDFFSKFIDKNDWDDFLTSINNDNLKNSDASFKTFNELSKPTNQNLTKGSSKSYLKISLISIGILAILFSVYYFNGLKQTENNLSEIEAVVKQANLIQLKCYKQLPTFDTTGLNKYYIVGSNAYLDIEKVLIRNSKSRQWTLKTPENPSNYTFLGIKPDYIYSDSAKVTVNELWHLQYFNAEDIKKEEFTYKSITPCACYFLKKINGQWKIYNCLFTHNIIQDKNGKRETMPVNIDVCPCKE